MRVVMTLGWCAKGYGRGPAVTRPPGNTRRRCAHYLRHRRHHQVYIRTWTRPARGGYPLEWGYSARPLVYDDGRRHAAFGRLGDERTARPFPRRQWVQRAAWSAADGDGEQPEVMERALRPRRARPRGAGLCGTRPRRRARRPMGTWGRSCRRRCGGVLYPALEATRARARTRFNIFSTPAATTGPFWKLYARGVDWYQSSRLGGMDWRRARRRAGRMALWGGVPVGTPGQRLPSGALVCARAGNRPRGRVHLGAPLIASALVRHFMALLANSRAGGRGRVAPMGRGDCRALRWAWRNHVTRARCMCPTNDGPQRRKRNVDVGREHRQAPPREMRVKEGEQGSALETWASLPRQASVLGGRAMEYYALPGRGRYAGGCRATRQLATISRSHQRSMGNRVARSVCVWKPDPAVHYDE